MMIIEMKGGTYLVHQCSLLTYMRSVESSI